METYKCVVVGDSNVGKTSLLTTYKTGQFPFEPHMLEIFEKSILFEHVSYTISLCDTFGGDDDDFFKIKTIIIYVDRDWVPEISKYCPGTPYLIVGTKIDLREDLKTLERLTEKQSKPLTFKEGAELAKTLRAVKYVECSALTHNGLDKLFDEAISAILQRKPKPAKSVSLIMSQRKRCIVL